MTTTGVPAGDRRYFPALNAVRAIGALGVVATHTAYNTGEVTQGAHGAFLSRLDFGVTLFFVLSGFLLSRPYFRAHATGRVWPSYRHYLWKRALRILPLYWVTVALALLVLPGNDGSTPGTWLLNLTLTQIYTSGLLSAGLTQMWSLCTEVAFYLLLPAVCALLLRAGSRRRWSDTRVLYGLLASTVLGLVWQTLVAPVSDSTRQHFHQWLPGFFPWFAVGMVFAFVSVTEVGKPADSRWHLLERWGHDLLGCWLIGVTAFVIACTPVAGPRMLVTPDTWHALLKAGLYAVSAAFLILPLVFGPERDGVARRMFSSRFAVWLGDVSYGIFCLHLLVLHFVMQLLDVPLFTGHFQNVFLLTVVGTVLLSAVTYYLIERPILRLKNAGPFAPRTAQPSASTPSS